MSSRGTRLLELDSAVMSLAAILALTLSLVACERSSSGGSKLSVENSGAAMPGWDGSLVTRGESAYFLVSESSQNTQDLNQDGDIADNVVHVIDSTTGDIVNLRRSSTRPILTTDNYVVWLTSELQEGRVDFSNDGDTGDHVLTIYDPNEPRSGSNPLVTSVAVNPGSMLLTDGDTVAFMVSEFEVRADFNLDDDREDFQVRCYEIPEGQLLTSGANLIASTAVDSESIPFWIDHSMLGFVSEDADGATQAMVMNIETQQLTNTGLTVGGSIFVAGTQAEPVLVFAVSETDADANFNGATGDSDRSDNVLCVYKIRSNFPVFPFGGIAVDANRFAWGDDRLVAIAIEGDNGLTGDLNSDFDQNDSVPFWLDTDRPLEGTSLGIAAAEEPILQVCDGYCVFLASEAGQGENGTNYNEEDEIESPDSTDNVAFFLNLEAQSVPVNTGYAANGMLCVEDESLFFITSPETDQGRDLNSNGITDDIVPIYFRVENGQIIEGASEIFIDGPIALEVCSDRVRLYGNASEETAFGQDMNFDGDSDDFIFCAAEIRRSNGKWLSFTDFFTSDLTGAARPVVGEGAVYFPFAEEVLGDGENFNPGSGDPDRTDLILMMLRSDCD